MLTCVALACTFGACEKTIESEPLPDTAELVDIFVDLHLAEMPLTRVPHAIKDSIGGMLREKVAMQHDMTIEELNAIVIRVQLDLELNTAIYDSVEARLDEINRTGIIE